MPEPQQAQAPAGETPGAQQQPQQQPQDFEAWLSNQPETVRGLYETHTSKLKNALSSERESRKELERQVADLAKKAEKGSEMEQQIARITEQMAEAGRRADFFEAASGAGVKNAKLAYVVAIQDGLIGPKGQVNWEAMKSSYPELFGSKPGSGAGNAGAGTGNPPPASGNSMNDYIRRAAGRR